MRGLAAGVLAAVAVAGGVVPAEASARSGAGSVTVFAGGGSDSGNGVRAVGANLGAGTPSISDPVISLYGVAADQRSDVYLSDSPLDEIKIVPAGAGVFFGRRMRAGDIYTIAGTGARGDSPSGVLAARAAISIPQGLAVDPAGNVVFADSANGKVKVVAARRGTYYGLQMRAARIYVIAGGGTEPSADGVPATDAAMFPLDVKIDAHGNVLFTAFDPRTGEYGVWVRSARSGLYYGQQMTAGDLYLIAGGGTSTANGVPGPAAYLEVALGLALDQAGNVIISDYFGNVVRILAVRTGLFYGQQMTAGDIYTIAGGGKRRVAGSLATASAIGHPDGVAVDQDGNVIVAISGVRKLLQVIAAATGTFYGHPMTAGHLYTITGGGQVTTPAGQPGTRIRLFNPEGVTVLPTAGIILAELQAGLVLNVHAFSSTGPRSSMPTKK